VPTYQYACTDCAEPLEVVQKFSDDALTVCPSCGGRLRKVFSPVGIVFKGSGFYRTDSRKDQKSAEPALASANGKSGDGGSGSDSGSSSGDKGGDKKTPVGSGSSASSSTSGSSSSSGSTGSSGSSGSGSSSASGSKVA
jgi:putative FmdB family regulatory protein